MKHNRKLGRPALMAGIAIASIAMLTACGTTATGGTGGGEAAAELGEMEGQVSLLAWPG